MNDMLLNLYRLQCIFVAQRRFLIECPSYILITKPTRCTNFSNLFLEWNSTCFGQSLCPSSGVYDCIHSNRYMSYRLYWLLASRIWIPLASSQYNLYDIYLLLCMQYKTADDGQKTCLKHEQFYSKNKFKKLALLFGFIIIIVFTIIYISHGVGPLVDPFRSHVSRSLFKGLPWFLLPAGEQYFITLGNLFRGILFTCCNQLLLYSSNCWIYYKNMSQCTALWMSDPSYSWGET